MRKKAVLLFLVLVCMLDQPGCLSEKASRPAPNVLLVTLDTLRSDWIHAYGFSHSNTPSMDALAARGVLFENAIAAASLTAPSHASMMTGLYARGHSVGTLNGESRLEGVGTLAEEFSEAGLDHFTPEPGPPAFENEPDYVDATPVAVDHQFDPWGDSDRP